jgi:hypothetical protein
MVVKIYADEQALLNTLMKPVNLNFIIIYIQHMNKLCLIVCAVMLFGCKGNEKHDETIVQDSLVKSKSQVEYTCPMHPEIISDTPMTCPRCGMELQIKS